jgi:peptide/nickel transport system substrate-binding protein
MNRRRFIQSAAAGSAGPIAASGSLPALAQDARRETLVVANEFGPNSLDIHGVGANRPAYAIAVNAYDRLMTFGRKKLPDGTQSYDYNKLEPELAESWQVAKDGQSVVFRLRKDATFHDGSPVTARDVKWSYDRALGMGGFPQFQMRAGSLNDPKQFIAVDDHTFRVELDRRDKMAMPNMAVPVPSIYNAALARKHATSEDPWAANWLRTNTAGGGAFRVEAWRPGQELIYARFDKWRSGPLPRLRRIVQREVPSAGNRRALLARGDIDMTYELPPKDFQEMAKEGGAVRVVSTPVENALFYIGMNTARPPFNNPLVRQAVAWAIPYDRLMDIAFWGRGVKMWGAKSNTPAAATWPQPTGYDTNIPRARELMKQAGVPDGFETTLSFDLGTATVSEPASILIQESLARIGIKVAINKVPGANWRAALLKKDMPLIFNRFGGWLNFPEYFFYWCYHGQNAVFNTMSYQNPAMDKLIDAARFETDRKAYEKQVRGFVEMAFTEVPRVPLLQPSFDVAMQKSVQGYMYWFHVQPDYRTLFKA